MHDNAYSQYNYSGFKEHVHNNPRQYNNSAEQGISAIPGMRISLVIRKLIPTAKARETQAGVVE